jgi:hypothetical protein
MAWTERYVRADAAGGGNGTTDANSGANGAWTLAEGVSNEAADMRINIKAGTYANGATTRTLTDKSGKIWWRGFKTTAGDLDARPTANRTVSTDMPHITFTDGQMDFQGGQRTISCISFLTTGDNFGYSVRVIADGTAKVHRCRFEHRGTSSGNNRPLRFNCNASGVISECYFKGNVGAMSLYAETTNPFVYGCVFDGGNIGIYSDGNLHAVGNLLFNQVNNAIETGSAASSCNICGNTIYNPGGHGILLPGSIGYTQMWVISRNLFHTVVGSGKSAIHFPTAAQFNIQRFSNAFYNCTTPETGFGDWSDFDRITEGSDPLTNPGSGDFTLKTSALSFQSGSPGLFEGLSIASYASIGAQIPDEVSSGGGGRPRFGRGSRFKGAEV